MITEYTIYLVNQSSITQKFWLFLSKAQGFEGNQVFANSSAYITVPSLYPGVSSFGIPVQYIVGAG